MLGSAVKTSSIHAWSPDSVVRLAEGMTSRIRSASARVLGRDGRPSELCGAATTRTFDPPPSLDEADWALINADNVGV
jgi:hypothetical protein